MKRSSLFMQAGLIVLPVVILSATLLYFLREDRGAIEREAREQAQRLTVPMAREFGVRFTELVRNGKILSPKGNSIVPEPAEWPAHLSPALAAAWAEAQDAVFRRKDKQAARRVLLRLAAAGTPRELQLNAELGLLRLDPRAGTAAALARKAGGVTTESGTPVAHLAWLIAIQAGDLSGLQTVILDDPGFLAPDLLDAAERGARSAEDRRRVAAFRGEWSKREKGRRMLRALNPQAAGETWFDFEGEQQLAIVDAATVAVIPRPVLEAAFADFVKEHRERMPAYAAPALEIAGRRIVGFPARAALGSSTEKGLTVSLDLAAPELLFRGYGRRWWLTVALILAAGLAALVGMASLWRGFERQMRLSRMKSDFVSSVSHELRAPIAAVQLMAESLEHGRVADASRQRDYYHLIVQECRRLSALVENVLDFSRIDRGTRQYRFEPVDVVALVRRTIALMEPIAREREVRLAMIEPDGDAIRVRPHWDDHAVEQTLVNLLDNAIKHSPAGSCVNAGIEAGQRGTIRVWVEDRGEGIPMEAQSQIFELFYRHGTELRRETTGAGIGLSIVKHVAEAHGGRVLVESTVGHGSRFALELPVEAQS